MLKRSSKIFLAGHKGLVGSAILRKLRNLNYNNIITIDKKKLDLTNQRNTINFFKKNRPEFVFICAAKVGGIFANNKYKADFIYNNLQIQNNLIHSSYLNKVKKIIFLGSSCVYPNTISKKIKETDLLTDKLEKTNEPYAIAKIAGIKMCQSYNTQYKTNFISLMPTNTFGPGDNYDLKNSHFIPALIKKIHNLKNKKKNVLNIWGTGKVRRELIYVDDLAEACIYFMKRNVKHDLINIGTGKDFTINHYAKKLLKILNVKAKIKYDKSKPDGTKRKLLDISVAEKYGWYPKTNFEDAILETYRHFQIKKKSKVFR